MTEITLKAAEARQQHKALFISKEREQAQDCLYNAVGTHTHTHARRATITLMMNCGETPFTNLRKSLGERKS